LHLYYSVQRVAEYKIRIYFCNFVAKTPLLANLVASKIYLIITKTKSFFFKQFHN